MGWLEIGDKGDFNFSSSILFFLFKKMEDKVNE